MIRIKIWNTDSFVAFKLSTGSFFTSVTVTSSGPVLKATWGSLCLAPQHAAFLQHAAFP